MKIFRSADILIPKKADMHSWSVVACDQFSSQPEYWDELGKMVGDKESTLKLMLPEAYLDIKDQFEEAEKINFRMDDYLERGIFRCLSDSYVYLERTLSSGVVRRGIVGVLDLECYDYSPKSKSPVRATEGTVEDRLPPRVRVRSGAALEMPHIMVFINDPKSTVMNSVACRTGEMEKLYDFELNCGGGHLRGWRVCGDDAQELERAVDALNGAAEEPDPVLFAMGDGNHSLATAKLCWEKIKSELSGDELDSHPARYSLVEIVNIHDEAITFEPIHKVVFGTKPDDFFASAEEYFAAASKDGDSVHCLRLVSAAGERSIQVRGFTIGQLIGSAEEFCQRYIAEKGGKIDYIHNDDTALEMSRRTGCAGILLPRMEKGELFPSIAKSGPFPKKSFSIGHAEDKRYYLECRKIR